MITPATALGAATAAAAAGWAAPAALRARVLRDAVCPGLAGVGRSDSVALTFDDGPDPEGTPAVLDALDRLGATATFSSANHTYSSSVWGTSIQPGGTFKNLYFWTAGSAIQFFE